MHEANNVLLSLFLIFVAAQIGAEISGRLKMPSVVGEIVAGIVIGPSVLGWLVLGEPGKLPEPFYSLKEIGVVLLLFAVGLETPAGQLKRVGTSAAMVGVLGVLFPFAMGFGWAIWAGHPSPKAAFIAAAFVATSVGITARVLGDMKVLGARESRIILGAAVIDDILAMMLLGVVTALQAGGAQGVSISGIAWVLIQAFLFIGIVALAGTRLFKKRSSILDAPINPHSPLTLSLALCLGLAVSAMYIGLAPLIGAFLAGMVLAEARQCKALEKQLEPILAFLTPFFFVLVGAQVQLSELASAAVLGAVASVTLLAIIGKLIGGYLGALREGKLSALAVGVGMVPRGEVGIIIAALGLTQGIFNGQVYAIVVAMSLLTSIVTPPVLYVVFKKLYPDTDKLDHEHMSATTVVPTDG